MRILVLFLLGCISIFSTVTAESLNKVDSEELEILLKEEKYVIVLFNREEACTGVCAEKESKLVAVRAELAEAIGAWVVRSDSRLWNLDETSVVFVRDSSPLLYTLEHESEDDMLDYFLANTKPKVKHLTDDNFEHDTQATSGATTGDWLLLFTREGCGEPCQDVLPYVHTVSSLLSDQLTVAVLNREEGQAPTTTRRLGVTVFPAVILIRKGKMYRLSSGTITTDELKSFALGGYAEADAEDIPPVKSELTDTYQAWVDWCRENPGTLSWSLLGGAAFIGFVILLNRPPPKSFLKKQKRR